jgi:hypothetical protein
MGLDLDALAKWAQILSVVIVLAAAIFGVVLAARLSSQSAAAAAAEAKAAAKDAKLIALATDDKIDKVAADLAAFKTQAVKEFVSAEAVGRIEGRIEEVGREMRAGIASIQDKLIELFSRPPRGKPGV